MTDDAVLSDTPKAALLRQFRADGWCSRCLAKEASPGHGTCPECREKSRKQSERRRRKARRTGLCRACQKNPRKKGRVNCVECIETERVRVRKAMRQLRKRRKKETGYANPPKAAVQDPPKTPTEPKESENES